MTPDGSLGSAYRLFEKKQSTGDIILSPDLADEQYRFDSSTLNCIQCRLVITEPAQAIDIDGRHQHQFTNPHGFNFEIACFGHAPGVRSVGAPSDFWSWFPGYGWRVALCQHCQLHLGWSFSNGNPFFGLIRTRLIEVQEDDHRH